MFWFGANTIVNLSCKANESENRREDYIKRKTHGTRNGQEVEKKQTRLDSYITQENTVLIREVGRV